MALGRDSLFQLEETELRYRESGLPPTLLSQDKVSRRNTPKRLVSNNITIPREPKNEIKILVIFKYEMYCDVFYICTQRHNLISCEH